MKACAKISLRPRCASKTRCGEKRSRSLATTTRLTLQPLFEIRCRSHDGDCGQIRLWSDPTAGCRCVSAEARAQLPSHGAIVSGRQQNTPGLGQPTAADVLAYSSKSGEYRRHSWSHVCRAATNQGAHLGNPTSVSYFTHAGRLSALRSMITRYSSRSASAIASRNSARYPLAARAGAAKPAARKRRHP